MPLHFRLGLVVALFCTGTISAAAPKGDDALMQLLQTRSCPECQLADVDLVHAQLQDADLAGAKFNARTSAKRGSMAPICVALI
jgi:hypothetical protein